MNCEFSKIDWGVEEVDFAYLMSLIEQELRAAETSGSLIDKFLEQIDLRIVVDDETPVPAPMIPSPPTLDFSNDTLLSEELARIYHSQELYVEAKEIYTKLFLLYSEKIAYFATQIDLLSTLTPAEVEQAEVEQPKNEEIIKNI